MSLYCFQSPLCQKGLEMLKGFCLIYVLKSIHSEIGAYFHQQTEHTNQWQRNRLCHRTGLISFCSITVFHGPKTNVLLYSWEIDSWGSWPMNCIAGKAAGKEAAAWVSTVGGTGVLCLGRMCIGCKDMNRNKHVSTVTKWLLTDVSDCVGGEI